MITASAGCNSRRRSLSPDPLQLARSPSTSVTTPPSIVPELLIGQQEQQQGARMATSGHGQPAGGLLALMSGPYGPVTQLPVDKERRINVHFRLPFMTKWGQSLVVTGSGALLGNMNYSKGITLKCHHEKDDLVWEALVSLPWQPSYQYKYALVSYDNGELVVEKEELVTRTLQLHEGLGHGDVVEVLDTWVDASYPGSILASKAFTQVIRQQKQLCTGGSVHQEQPALGEAVVHFQVMDWMLEDGQVICVTGSIPQLGMWQPDQMLLLTETNTPCWEGEIRVPYSAFAFTYKYAVITRSRAASMAAEAANGSASAAAAPEAAAVVGSPPESAVLTAAAIAAAAAAAAGGGTAAALNGPAVLDARMAGLSLSGAAANGPVPTSSIAVAASPAAGLDTSTAAAAAAAAAAIAGQPSYMAAGVSQQLPGQLGVSGAGIGAVFRNATSTLLEVGEPRVCSLPLAGAASMGAPAVVIRHDGFIKRDRLWRGAGVALPVFAARTRSSVGCGEFLDLLPLLEFADASGMRLIQVLPVNDTCVYNMWWDSYPYSSVCVYALHPQYLALRATLDDLPGIRMPADIAAAIEAARVKLDGPNCDYEGLMEAKRRISRQIFDAAGHKSLETLAYKEWFADNEFWLVPYAAFCFLRDLFGTAEHWRWGAMATPTPQVLGHITSPEREWHRSILCCYWLQYQLHRQLKQVSEFATLKRVALKGDLPIGVDKRSVDTWLEPHLFRMDKSTGSPPDFFDPNGQNWGFPTYNWEAMAEEGYAWWKRRLSHLAQYFSAYRIDHILGFCRIWEIPGDCATGLLGYFRPSIPITAKDLEVRGMSGPAVLERLTEPYVTKALLLKLFGPELASEVSARYFIEGQGPGGFRFRPEYYSEKVLWELKPRPNSPDWLVAETAQIRKGLLTLRQNLVLVRDPENPDALYPRFALTSSSSYKDLPDAGWKAALAQLHDDYFYKRHDSLWRGQAMRSLPALMAASDMLICGEDLGFVPACLPPVMQELGLIGLRIQRMPSEQGLEFNNPATYPYLSVASPSCHDVSPLRAWYEEDEERRERFYYSMLGGGGAPPTSACPDVARLVVQQHFNCPSAWCILPLQDVFALMPRYSQRPAKDEVINDPTVTKHYWRYRMHVCIEDLLADNELISLLQDLLLLSDRATLADLPALAASS